MMAKVSIHITMELIHTCIRLFKFFTYQLKKNFDCSGPIFLLINVDRFCLVIAMSGNCVWPYTRKQCAKTKC